jgi:hypothetical protein
LVLSVELRRTYAEAEDMESVKKVVFVRRCAFCGGVMDRSEPEVTASLASRRSGSVSFTGHASCFGRTLHRDAAVSFDVADVADGRA